jgi:hypothetical protein
MGEVETYKTNPLVTLLTADCTPAERAKAQHALMEKVEDERFAKPVPRFLTLLPFGGDDDEITDRISSAILVAEDADRAQNEQGTTAGKELVGQKITVWDLRVFDGEKPGGWGAFLLLDVTVGDDEVHKAVNTGAKQAVARFANAWAKGQLPLSGTFAEIDGTGKRGNAAITFIAEEEPF